MAVAGIVEPLDRVLLPSAGELPSARCRNWRDAYNPQRHPSIGARFAARIGCRIQRPWSDGTDVDLPGVRRNAAGHGQAYRPPRWMTLRHARDDALRTPDAIRTDPHRRLQSSRACRSARGGDAPGVQGLPRGRTGLGVSDPARRGASRPRVDRPRGWRDGGSRHRDRRADRGAVRGAARLRSGNGRHWPAGAGAAHESPRLRPEVGRPPAIGPHHSCGIERSRAGAGQPAAARTGDG